MAYIKNQILIYISIRKQFILGARSFKRKCTGRKTLLQCQSNYQGEGKEASINLLLDILY